MTFEEAAIRMKMEQLEHRLRRAGFIVHVFKGWIEKDFRTYTDLSDRRARILIDAFEEEHHGEVVHIRPGVGRAIRG